MQCLFVRRARYLPCLLLSEAMLAALFPYTQFIIADRRHGTQVGGRARGLVPVRIACRAHLRDGQDDNQYT